MESLFELECDFILSTYSVNNESGIPLQTAMQMGKLHIYKFKDL